MIPLVRDIRIGVIALSALTFQTSANQTPHLPGLAGPTYLKASNTGAEDLFGQSVAVSGNTMVVGAPYEDGSGTGVNPVSNELAEDAGAAYVYVRAGSTWALQAYLKASNTAAGDLFGTEVAISGNTVVVGGKSTYVFARNGTTWSQQADLQISTAPFTSRLSVSGDTVVVGLDDGARVFVRSGTTWNQQALLTASNQEPGDGFAWSVTVSGDTIVVGAPFEDGSGTGVNPLVDDNSPSAGAAYVFVRSGTMWTQQAYLKASNTEGNDLFGWAVAVSGNTVVVGAILEDGSGMNENPTPNNNVPDSGAAYVFLRTGTIWTQQAYLKASNPGGNDEFGWSVGLSGNTAVVGALLEGGSGTGTNPGPNEGAPEAGAAYVFARSGSAWSQHAYLKASNPGARSVFGDAGDLFGTSVAVSGSTVVAGSPHEDGSGTGVNPASNEGAFDAGAAYVFDAPAPPALVHLNDDSNADVLTYGSSTGTWSRHLAQSDGTLIPQSLGAWSPGWTISPANFDGDEVTDFFLYNTTTGAWAKMLAGVTDFTTESSGSWWQGWQRYVMELDGDGISDIFLYDPLTGQWFKCVSTPTGFSYTQGGWNPGWELHTMRFDTDRLTDLFLFHRSTGQWFWALGQSGADFSYPRSEAWYPNWQLYPGDFNADGLSDLLLHDPPSGAYFVATTGASGFDYVQGGWSPGWTPYVADLDGDDREDVFLHDAATGAWAELITNVFGTFDNVGGDVWTLGWSLYLTDANGDRRADILLYDSTNGTWWLARNLVNGSFSYTSETWAAGLTIVTRSANR